MKASAQLYDMCTSVLQRVNKSSDSLKRNPWTETQKYPRCGNWKKNKSTSQKKFISSHRPITITGSKSDRNNEEPKTSRLKEGNSTANYLENHLQECKIMIYSWSHIHIWVKTIKLITVTEVQFKVLVLHLSILVLWYFIFLPCSSSQGR